jgi:hypothetical protein
MQSLHARAILYARIHVKYETDISRSRQLRPASSPKLKEYILCHPSDPESAFAPPAFPSGLPPCPHMPAAEAAQWVTALLRSGAVREKDESLAAKTTTVRSLSC